MNPKYRRKVIIRGEGDALRVGREIIKIDRGNVSHLNERGLTAPAPYAVVEIEEDGQRMYVVAHRGAIPGEPDTWSIGPSCPAEAELPAWSTTWKSEPGKASPELAVILSLGSTVKILEPAED